MLPLVSRLGQVGRQGAWLSLRLLVAKRGSLVRVWVFGKTVRIRRGPAAVTGDEDRTEPLEAASASGKARSEIDPGVRRPTHAPTVPLSCRGP